MSGCSRVKENSDIILQMKMRRMGRANRQPEHANSGSTGTESPGGNVDKMGKELKAGVLWK